jgi:regulator of replication initiation timing
MTIPVEALVAVLTLMAAPLAAAMSWKLMKRNHTVEADSTAVQAANMSVDMMLHVLSQLRMEVAELTQESHALREENKALHLEVQRLRALVSDLGGRV